MSDNRSAGAPSQPRAQTSQNRRIRTLRTRTWPLFLLVAISGMTTMAVEMAASRLLGPYFGDSILVWANLIGLILIYLTLGAHLGGRWADRNPRPESLYTMTAGAALWVGLIPLAATPILHIAQTAFGRIGAELAIYDGLQIGGSFVSVLILLGPPIVLLGTVSPFAIRLATRHVHLAGRSAGRIYALSTVGSIVGTFAPVLVTIPTLGTARTFYFFGALLLAASIIGLVIRRARLRALLACLALIVLLIVATLFPRSVVKADDRMIYETESRLNYIQVLEVDDIRYLMLNEGQAVHSIYDPDSLATFGTWDVLTIAPFFNNPPFTAGQVRRVCIIGLAGGTIARQATAIYGPIPIDGIEIDPEIVQVGYEFFAMDQPGLTVYITDGRFFLQHTDQRYDLIVIDAYRLPYIPFQLTTTEFFDLARTRLTPSGVLAVNVGRTGSDYRMVEAIAATLADHFASVHAINLPDTFNTVLVATQQETYPDNLRQNAMSAEHSLVSEIADQALANLYPLAGDGRTFTDDRAPVESLTNAIILRYLLKGE